MDEDVEQKRSLEKNKKVYEFVNSEYWPILTGMVFEEVNDLQSIMNLDAKEAEEVVLELRVRKNVIESLMSFIQKIEGESTQYEQNELSGGERNTGHILRENP